MSNMYDDWLKKDGESRLENLEINQTVVPNNHVNNLDTNPSNEPTVVTIVNPMNERSSGALLKGLLAFATVAVVGAGVYLYADSNNESTDTQDALSEDQNRPVYELSNTYDNNAQALGSVQTEVRPTGCQRQLTGIDGVIGAYTKNGSNTDLCWELGETVSSTGKTRGVITLWGESPYAGKIDDEIIHDKFISNDISTDEIRAFMSSFVIDVVSETDLVVIDRSGENYLWEVNGRLENVVVKLEVGQK